MAEDTPGIQNKGLLLIAVVLAAIVVVVYNIHISAVRRAGQAQKIKLLCFTNDLKAGDKILPRDLETREVDASSSVSLGNVAPAEQYGLLTTGSIVNQAVKKGQWVLWEHTTGGGGPQPWDIIDPGLVCKTLRVDLQYTLGELLRSGAYVNLTGPLPSADGKGTQSIRIIKGLKVLAVGGRRMDVVTGRGMSSEGGTLSNQSVQVQVTEEVSLQLDNVLSHVRGVPRLELTNNPRPAAESPKLTKEALPFAGVAAIPVGAMPSGTSVNE